MSAAGVIVHAGGPEPEPRRPLNGLSDVRAFFHTNAVPLYFVSPTPFNLLGIDRWVRNFFYLTYFDSFEGAHSRVFVPRRRDRIDFGSMGDVCNHLLRDPETLEFIAQRGPGGKACFVMLDEQTQALAHQAGLEVMHPSAELRHRLGSKIVMTRLADEAGVPSVPHVMGRVGSYDELLALAQSAGLGDDLVVEAAYGDAGNATFFVRGQRDWDHCAADLVGQQEVKVMKRIRNVEVCLEGTVTRHGTVIGPAMTSLVGYPELTPRKGGWCGNDIWREVLPPAQTHAAREMVRKLGDVLRREGYRGYFEVDLLVAVGTALSGGPPHRSQRAELPHWAPRSGPTPVHSSTNRRTRSSTLDTHRFRLCVRSTLCWPRSPRAAPFPPPFPQPHSGLVRRLRRYYETVRLPTTVHLGRAASAFPERPAPFPVGGQS